MTANWSSETLSQAEWWPDAGLVRDGLRLFDDLPRSARTEVLLATDRAYFAVLRAEWARLDAPLRLQGLAERHLRLKPLAANGAGMENRRPRFSPATSPAKACNHVGEFRQRP